MKIIKINNSEMYTLSQLKQFFLNGTDILDIYAAIFFHTYTIKVKSFPGFWY